jgi:hypothetical protein
METEKLKPEESLKIIEDIIETEKLRFAENGYIYRFWGWLIIVAALSQYVLIKMHFAYNYLPWFLMILGSIYTGFYYSKKKKKAATAAMSMGGRVITISWLVISLNIFLAAFLMHNTFATALLFVILSFVAFGTMISGSLLRFKALIYGGAACNIIAFASLYVGYEYWNLLTALAVVFSNLIPGYILKKKYSAKNV